MSASWDLEDEESSGSFIELGTAPIVVDSDSQSSSSWEAQAQASVAATLAMTFDLDLDQLDPNFRSELRAALGAFLGISEENVRIISILPGSIVIQ
eukprot:SAG11_NODE_30072_length_304_cov_1.009756_1_plen_95_part_10